tara:strand:+ start:456 stop:575 length:120 start_codon:yes stop_codon:yes gene_type:complete
MNPGRCISDYKGVEVDGEVLGHFFGFTVAKSGHKISAVY